MRIVKRMGLVLVAACALCALAVSSASAALPLFLAHPPGALSAKALSALQVFKAGGSNVECKALKALNSSASQLRAETQHVTIDYETCKAFGLSAVVSPVLYLFHADESVDLIGHVTITAPSCIVLVKPKTGLKTVKYRNLNGAISITGEVKGILSEGIGAACSFAEESGGTYVGTADVWLTNTAGTVRWDAG